MNPLDFAVLLEGMTEPLVTLVKFYFYLDNKGKRAREKENGEETQGKAKATHGYMVEEHILTLAVILGSSE